MSETPVPADREIDKEPEARRVLSENPKALAARIAIFRYLAVAVLVYLLCGFWALQIRDPDYYADLAEKNYIRSQPLPAPRGRILDRDGRVIVDNHSSFSLYLSRDNLEEGHLDTICKALGIDRADLDERLRRYDRTRAKYEAINVRGELTSSELAFIDAHSGQDNFPEMEVIQTFRRIYPRDGVMAHVIGYTGEISENELDSAEFARYKQGDIIGKIGIERQYNDILMGTDGQRRVLVNNRNKILKVIDHKGASAGKDIRLTLDLDLQAVAELSMQGRKGAVVALDPTTGEVLAMVSRPAYDLNRFVGRIQAKDWAGIRDNPEYPLMNRAIQAQFAPGSTFKPIVAMAALEEGIIDDRTSSVCRGGATYYDRYFKCNVRTGHGHVGLNRALAISCNIFFHDIGTKISIDKIAEYADLAGLGRKSGIDLPAEAEGTVPSRRWKIRTQRQRWFSGETVSVVIGQGALTVTPLQLASAIGGLVRGGEWRRPHLLMDPAAAAEPVRKARLKPENVAKVVNGMFGVVNQGGTATVAAIPGIELCGKTGTAQLASNDLIRSRKLGITLSDNAWFVGFAPRNSPEIVVAALYEHGEHGIQAAPIVRDVVKAYFDKKNRKQSHALLASTPRRQ
jgi:penicillin-binding protein 2